MADLNIYGAVRSMAGDGKAAYASQLWDERQQKFQSQINEEADGALLEITEEEFNQIFD